MERPYDWPRSPLFTETSPDAIKRQKAFYDRCYGHSLRQNLNERVLRHLEYLDYVSVPEAHRVSKPSAVPQLSDTFKQLILGLDDL